MYIYIYINGHRQDLACVGKLKIVEKIFVKEKLYQRMFTGWEKLYVSKSYRRNL